MKARSITLLGVFLASSVVSAQSRTASAPPSPTLDIYVTDTEGGKATLFVSPSGETVLIDTGNPGERDLGRVMQVLGAAGVKKIDYLISSCFRLSVIGCRPASGRRNRPEAD